MTWQEPDPDAWRGEVHRKSAEEIEAEATRLELEAAVLRLQASFAKIAVAMKEFTETAEHAARQFAVMRLLAEDRASRN